MPEEVERCYLCGAITTGSAGMIIRSKQTGAVLHGDCALAWHDNPCAFCAVAPPPGGGRCCVCKKGSHFVSKYPMSPGPARAIEAAVGGPDHAGH